MSITRSTRTRSYPSPRRAALASLLVSCALPQLAQACATCGCTLSTDAATGYSTQSGWRINLDYTYIDQNQLRHGGRRATANQVVDQPANPALDGGEIERSTVNRYINLTAMYRFNMDWGISLIAPYVIRDHSSYGTQLQPYSAAETASDQLSGTHVAGLGDIKLLGSYQGFLPTHNLGLQFGVKLPTGRYGGQAASGDLVGHPVTFRNGPALGQSLDTDLQAGTGSTDLIIGGYYYQPVSQDFDAFASAQFQAAVKENLNQPGADYRPGNLTTISAGLRYEAHANWVPQLQLNWSHKMADQGFLADVPDTRGTVLYVSPGLSASLSRNLQMYAFVQVPLYSRLQGYQLFPGWTGTVGVSMKL